MTRPYPRIGAYVGVRSGGLPLVRPDFTLDLDVCQKFARFPQVAVDLNALLNSPSIVPTLKGMNPSIEIAGYHLTAHWYLDAGFTPRAGDTSFDASWHVAIKSTNGFVPAPPHGMEVNWGHKPTADALTALLTVGLHNAGVDAFFGDFFNPVAAFAGVGSEFSDQVRVQNMSRLVREVRKSVGKSYGNGSGADRCGHDGTLLEGFPNNFGNNFLKALTQKDGDWLKSEGLLSDRKSLRFLLGTACLTGATTSYGAQEVSPGGQPWPGTWWFDEYAVDPNGKPDPTGRYVGWLGQPQGSPYRMTNGLYVRQFDGGLVLVNPTGASQTIDLIFSRWKRINSTTPERVLSVNSQDAIFLWQ